MRIGSILENHNFEKRIAITPELVKKYTSIGFEVCLIENYGSHLGIEDKQFKEMGVKILQDEAEILNSSDIIVQLGMLSDDKISNIKENQTLIGVLNPYKNKEQLESLAKKKVNLFSLELLPRITRAQSMDILSSQANLAGYKAVIEASSIFKKALPMMMTAAGTIIPAKCLILGAGVAGLQAIATAKRLGCVVSAFDVRPEVEEQVNSLGAKFVKVEDGENTKEIQTVYAKEMSEDYKKKQLRAIHDVAVNMDIIISTALIPGKKAPLLIESNTISQMKSGSILIDLASSSGGNIEGSKIGEKVNINDCVVYAPRNLPSLIAYDASLLFSKNIYNFISNFITENKIFDIEAKDELLLKTTLVKNGNKTENFYDG